MPIWRDNRGFALVTVLGAVLVLALIAAGLSGQTSSDLRLALAAYETARDQALAEAGINRGILELLTDAAPPRPFHGRRIDYEFDGVPILIEIADEAGRVDINAASPPVLSRLLQLLGLEIPDADRLADRIADWRDEDDLVRTNGAEQLAYRAAGLASPGNRSFLTLAELQDVWELSPEIYGCLRPHVTLFSGRQSPDVRFMPSELRALWLSEADRETPQVLSALSQNAPASLSPVGRVYRITATIRSGTDNARSQTAIIRITGNRQTPYWILWWGAGAFAGGSGGGLTPPGG